MKVSYDKLFSKLKMCNIRQSVFLNETGLSGSTLQKLRNGETVTTATICHICDYFSCMPEDIMEFIPDTVPEADTTSDVPSITDSEQLPSKPSHPSELELRVNELMQQTVKIQAELLEIQKQLLK